MKLPKIDAFRDNVKIETKPGAAPVPSQVDPAMLKKQQEAIKKIQDKIAEIEKALNGGDYKRAFSLASGEIVKYTAQSLQGNDLLERMTAMAETALEYMDSLLPEKDGDWFLDTLGGTMVDYKDIPVFKAIERVLVDHLKKKLLQFKQEGKEAWIPRWLETWAPVVELIDVQKTMNKFLADDATKFKWKFKIPVKYAPGEKQRLLDHRHKINEALAAKAAELEKDIAKAPKAPAVPEESQTAPQPDLAEIPKVSKTSASSGAFSKKKATTAEATKKEAQPEKKRKPHPKEGKPKPLQQEDDHISTSEVKDYLHKLKYEQKVNEVHFIKIKNDLAAMSLNKEKKLFKILQALVEKGVLVKKQGSYYAILL